MPVKVQVPAPVLFSVLNPETPVRSSCPLVPVPPSRFKVPPPLVSRSRPPMLVVPWALVPALMLMVVMLAVPAVVMVAASLVVVPAAMSTVMAPACLGVWASVMVPAQAKVPEPAVLSTQLLVGVTMGAV